MGVSWPLTVCFEDQTRLGTWSSNKALWKGNHKNPKILNILQKEPSQLVLINIIKNSANVNGLSPCIFLKQSATDKNIEPASFNLYFAAGWALENDSVSREKALSG